MREIKFRVWNKKTKEWEHGPDREVNLFGECILLGGFMRVGLKELNDCVPLQFTGLKDKNGVEIYEGDILQEKLTEEMAANGEESNVGRVYFVAGTFMIDGDGPLYELTYSLTPDILEDYVVTGNTFENPELICN